MEVVTTSLFLSIPIFISFLSFHMLMQNHNQTAKLCSQQAWPGCMCSTADAQHPIVMAAAWSFLIMMRAGPLDLK
jgi:hypothetical protein